MNYGTLTISAVFFAVYVGMALGRWPGLKIDRSGIATLGAIVLYATGSISGPDALEAMEFPTLAVLFGLMILSAQFAACGFYDWCSARIVASRASPVKLLAFTVAVSGGLSAVLANDIVVFAMTPMLIAGLARRRIDSRPYLIALAGGANAGSAATMIGNPQNILIGQVGKLNFWDFVVICGPPAVFGLLCVFGVVWFVWRTRLRMVDDEESDVAVPDIDRVGVGKAILATITLLVLFALPLSQATGVLAVAGVLLISRRLATREFFSLVDWHLLVLFAGLFIVTASLNQTGLPRDMLVTLTSAGIDPTALPSLVVLALVGSNIIGNVPAVVLLLAIIKNIHTEGLYALAVLSTLAGNLLIVGSLANIIVVERAKQSGVDLGFAEHARCGVPMTLCSVVAAIVWFAILGSTVL